MKTLITSILLFSTFNSIALDGQVKLKFLYRMANNPAAIQNFYCNNLGAKCGGDAKQGFISVILNNIELLFFKSDYDIKTPNAFAWQPGYKGSNENLNSLSLQYTRMSDFKKIVNNLTKSKVPMMTKVPEWRRDSYWGITVRDPMNTTLELYFVPKEKPKTPKWSN